MEWEILYDVSQAILLDSLRSTPLLFPEYVMKIERMFDNTIERLMSSTLVEASCKSLLSVKPNLFPIQVSYTHIPNLMVQIPALLTYTFIQKRGAEPILRDFTKIIIFFIYIPSSPRQSTSISLFLKSSYKLQYLTVHCKHKREIDISWRQ